MQEAITVSRYNTYIKQIFDAEELLHNIQIIGEVFGVSFSRQATYFSLKDDLASISCVCFYPQLTNLIKEGDLIIVTGSPNYYIKGGKLSFNVTNIEQAGLGLLYQKFIEMKNKLEKEGLFEQSHKINIPDNVKRIGVITSKDGAVIRDIINVSNRRNPSIDIVLYPTKVQGNGAEEEIAYAIEKMDNYDKIDVVVVARGGGSLEDLWAYNSEKVARATYNCKKPIISAVGHETDFTIIDFVADLRAPTPSAAAELLTYNILEKKSLLEQHIKRLYLAINNYYQTKKDKQAILTNDLILKSSNIERFERNKLDKNVISLENISETFINNNFYELGLLDNSLQKLSPVNILKRGYAKIEQQGKVVDKAKDIMILSDLEINFIDGKVIAIPKRLEERE